MMLHSPRPETMLKDQDFPISLETQLLGGLGDGKPRTTANLCTPGTNVVMEGKLRTEHCINSTSKTYDGDQWVRVEVVVHGDELVRTSSGRQVVLEYTRPQIGGGNVAPVDPKVRSMARRSPAGTSQSRPRRRRSTSGRIELLEPRRVHGSEGNQLKSYVIRPKAGTCRVLTSAGTPGALSAGNGGQRATALPAFMAIAATWFLLSYRFHKCPSGTESHPLRHFKPLKQKACRSNFLTVPNPSFSPHLSPSELSKTGAFRPHGFEPTPVVVEGERVGATGGWAPSGRLPCWALQLSGRCQAISVQPPATATEGRDREKPRLQLSDRRL